ncbi:MAG: hypothetical protein AAF387_10310 [Pseudomonadota bacterium]
MKVSSLLTAFLIILGCSGETHFGSDHEGFGNFPETPIPVEVAIEISQPYLAETFTLRQASRETNSNKDPVTWVTLRDGWYHIVKDNYPSYSPGFYLKHAVKINSITGEIIEPET